MSDLLQIASLFAFAASMGEPDEEKKIEARANIIFRTPGIIKPIDWDDLPLAEKKRRLDGADAVAFDK